LHDFDLLLLSEQNIKEVYILYQKYKGNFNVSKIFSNLLNWLFQISEEKRYSILIDQLLSSLEKTKDERFSCDLKLKKSQGELENINKKIPDLTNYKKKVEDILLNLYEISRNLTNSDNFLSSANQALKTCKEIQDDYGNQLAWVDNTHELEIHPEDILWTDQKTEEKLFNPINLHDIKFREKCEIDENNEKAQEITTSRPANEIPPLNPKILEINKIDENPSLQKEIPINEKDAEKRQKIKKEKSMCMCSCS